jgi:tetratricopeptide (TPR) repeat protein
MANIIKHLSSIFLFSLMILMPTTIFTQENNTEPVNRAEHPQAQQQQQKAQLEVTVINEDKEPISNVEIQLILEGSDETFHSMSDDKGVISSPPLSPGKYILTIEQQGYKNFSGDLELSAGRIRKITIVLAKEEPVGQKTEKEAIKSFEKAIEFSKANKIDDAIVAFQKAVELKPDFAEAYLNLGILLFQKQKDDEAEKALVSALMFNPNEPRSKIVLADVNFEQAKLLIREKKMDQALEKLEQSYRFRQDHAFVNYLLGYLYYQKKRKDDAVKHLKAFIQLAPNAPQVETANKILKSLNEKK